jgi:hypothetical protein
MDAGTGPSDAHADSSAGAGYDFHDPAFVTWWLNSLYLLPLEDQIAIAQRLLTAVHAPGSRREVEAFLAVQGQELEARGAPVLSPGDLAVEVRDEGDWRCALREAWRARPWLTGIGLLALALLVLKGIWSLWRYAAGF